MLRGSEVSKDSYHSSIKKQKQLKNYKLSQINSGQFTFKTFTKHLRLKRKCYGLMRADSSDIVDHRLKLILGLIWTLILHYSISMPVWDDDENRGELPEQTPKQRLLGWVQNKQPDRPVTNFTTDWNDGRAIGALVDGIAPGNIECFFSL